ncbi:serine/threonine protein kinase [Pelomonas sp. CA6]|uniref:serine/threonine-protein kinase n=1 Tax=Pelomonas sp. CA6 TaxID=2907999 RepID=UPI001F4AF558|nr:serine/threonine-protein kinase [Pelomonas sp. CA6]MCH7342531.1 serine/threonine protein kinase [Pelomonas sp. CA6]
MDKSRWAELSPLLDELLDLAPAAREARLRALGEQDSTLAADLQELLAEEDQLSREGFLDRASVLRADAVAQAAAALDGGAPKPQMPDLGGQRLGPYELERELGQGGMGAVWLARRADGRFDGLVAVKFLKAGLVGKTDSGRFAREGQILARLSHPHIARLLDAGVQTLPQGPQPYLVLEYVDGQPIDRYCQEQGLGVEGRIRLFLDVLAAVGHAHQRLILHRDLKPSNILVDAQGQVKLLDFGIAKLLDDATQGEQGAAATELTRRAGHAFTPQFAAPEQVQQLDVTTATDVYALGVLLYLLLGGRHPTADDTQTELDRLRAVMELEPKRLSEIARRSGDPAISREAGLLRGDLDTIVAKALKKKAAERYPNTEAFADDLRRWLVHEPISARPDSRLYVLGRFVRRHRLAVGAGSLAVLALVGLTSVSVLQARRAEAAEQQAQTRRQQAEDLLSYMLGEFADKLRPVGRLELLDSVGSKALHTLTQGRDGTLGAMERLQRAKALTVIGEVRVSKRELEQAIEPLTAANALLQGEPPSPEMNAAWRKAQGATAFWLGHVAYTQRRFDAAQQSWSRYREVSRQWLKAAPQDLDAQVELSYAENSLGSLHLDQGQLDEAEQAFRRSIALKDRVLAKRPEDADLTGYWIDSASWLGSTLMRRGRFLQARAVSLEALQRADQLRRRYPADLSWLKRYADSAYATGLAEFQIDGRVGASGYFAQSVQGFASLTRQDPSNRLWASGLIRAETALLRTSNKTPSLAPVQALSQRLTALEAGRRPSARWHPLRVELALMEAQALAGQGQGRLGRVRLEKAWELVQTDLSTSLRDLDLTVADLDLQLMMARLTQQGLERRAECQRLMHQHPVGTGMQLLRVHAGVTKAWAGVLECAGLSSDARSLQHWLESQRMLPAQPLSSTP